MLLHEIQDKFINYLLTKDPAINKYISLNDGLKHYYNSYYLRLIEVLNFYFEYTANFLGGNFNNIAMDYIKSNPSHSYCFTKFGADFPSFLRNLKSEEEYLADFAEFEWCLHQVDTTQTGVLMNIDDLLNLQSHILLDTVFEFNSSLKVIISNYNLTDFYQKISEEDEDEDEADHSDYEIEFFDEKQIHIVWRKGLSSIYKTLSSEEELLFELLGKKNSFVQCCESLSDYFSSEDLTAEFVSNCIAEWVEEGLFLKIH